MTLRVDYFSLAPDAIQILMKQEAYLRDHFSASDTVTVATWELVKLRVSQINQCAFCVDMHSKDALELGESNERLIGLSAWRDMPMYTEVERTALAWAECLTAGQAIDDQTYKSTVAVLGEKVLIDLTVAVNAINSWNRVVKAFKPEVGSYKPQK
ncbi:carboxymuconolactone decarboxylase family protein [Agarilytica rhodophyticola]|uniref:carboxymuconolactone decarboxylase family protein n=1 Tax=Agarilytica rhodophyticola TaxID=1737490 RepID=UPI000B34563E|nr:carboxymuconolactone decarboxylase family protein [Agarilytica rhodophyticola]